MNCFNFNVEVGKAHAYMWRLVNGLVNSLVSARALQEQFYTEGCSSRDRYVGGERVGVATIV